jgi:hypothetical protein
MDDRKLYDLMAKQKDFIINLIREYKILEAKECFNTVSDLWVQGNYLTGLKEVLSAIREARKPFSEEVRITGR